MFSSHSDSNSDLWSRGRELWPLDLHHGPWSISFIYLTRFDRVVKADTEAPPVVEGVDLPEVELLVEVIALENVLVTKIASSIILPTDSTCVNETIF